MKYKYVLFLLTFVFASFAQEEQAGIELAASFPAITEGTIEYDLPADGSYWDPDDPGWGVSVEIQKRPSVPGGFFLFMTAFFYDENNEPFWCAVSSEFDPQVSPHQWRDAKAFSNIPWGPADPQVLVDMDVDCHSKSGGTALGSRNKKTNRTSKITKLKLVWRTPSRLEITPEGGQTHFAQRLAMHDDLVNPSLDWITSSYWLVTSSVRVHSRGFSGVDGTYTAREFDFNVRTGFEPLDASNQADLRGFVGHQEGYAYYISTLKASHIPVDYYNFSNNLQETIYAPYINGGAANVSWLVLVHDPWVNTVSLYTVAGSKEPELLRPFAGIAIKFRADVNPDADVIDFYPFIPDCFYPPPWNPSDSCDTYFTNNPISMANWSPQNVHTNTMKMFKLRTGGKGYLYTPNNGETGRRATERITQMLIDDGTLDDPEN